MEPAPGRTTWHRRSVTGHEHEAPKDPHARRVLAVVLAVSTAILVVEVIGALWSGSLALLADAGHMLTDVAGLSLGLVAAVLSGRPATLQRTWGFRRGRCSRRRRRRPCCWPSG